MKNFPNNKTQSGLKICSQNINCICKNIWNVNKGEGEGTEDIQLSEGDGTEGIWLSEGEGGLCTQDAFTPYLQYLYYLLCLTCLGLIGFPGKPKKHLIKNTNNTCFINPISVIVH